MSLLFEENWWELDWQNIADRLTDNMARASPVHGGKTQGGSDQMGNLEINPPTTIDSATAAPVGMEEFETIEPVSFDRMSKELTEGSENRQAKRARNDQPINTESIKQDYHPKSKISTFNSDARLSDDDVQIRKQQNEARNKIMKSDRPKQHVSSLTSISPSGWQFKTPALRTQEVVYVHIAKQFMEQFQSAIEGIFEKIQNSSIEPAARKIGDWNFKMIPLSTAHPEVPMSLIVPLISKSELLNVFQDLHHWLTYIHKILWKHFHGETFEIADRQKLIHWLFGEVFNPQYGLPVLGETEIRNLVDGKFGLVQVLVIKMLREPESVFNTSIQIVRIWFKSLYSRSEWENKFKMDEYFWARISTLITKQSSQDSLTDFKIGNFQLKPKIKIVSFPKKKGDITLKLPYNTGIYQELILPRIEDYCSKVDSGREVDEIATEPTIAIIKHKSVATMCGIQPLSYNTEKIDPFLPLDSILTNWFEKLEFYSCIVISILNSQLGDNHEKLSHTSFLAWFSEKLFNSSHENMLPVIGIIPRSTINSESKKIPMFDEPQKFIIKTLGIQVDTDWDRSAITLLGYWLKNEHPKIWNIKFKTDQGFSDFLFGNWIVTGAFTIHSKFYNRWTFTKSMWPLPV
ncbi:hypothetical protein MJO28_000627 [Puccinia striiformis f. sp. tritici]|uniref:Uncharacterized protein n=1 Tax=Puccinia striiformis f. sp. tritici TaxID=168172 RepID=A0ACC0EXY8_9BASI|nr:hypothetical protein MJO28_000627 [Puccinia striiformis f. sp. tritici]